MKILISSKINAAQIADSLGQPEYSYYFLLKEFGPALALIGEVIEVADPAEVDAVHARLTAAGEEAVFVSFSPPHQTPLGLTCPTVSLFAWEFGSIPDQAWNGDPQQDWTYSLARLAGVIATSRFAADAVRRAMGQDYPVAAIPAAVFDSFAHLGTDKGFSPDLSDRKAACGARIIDTLWYGFSANGLVRRPDPPAPPPSLGEKLKITRRAIGDLITELRDGPPPPPAEPPPEERAPWAHVREEIDFGGVVYLTVLNPRDGRKNWVDIVTAFCWAHRDHADATLILKVSHQDHAAYQILLVTLLSRLEPFACRIVTIFGYLAEPAYEGLITAATFAVNAASAEGLCLPLMEALSAGKPVLAPRHTAMADYIDEAVGFVLETSPAPTCWPHDPTGALRTHSNRPNWNSLMRAYRASYALAKQDPTAYRSLSVAARKRMRAFSSRKAVAAQLSELLHRVADTAKAPA